MIYFDGFTDDMLDTDKVIKELKEMHIRMGQILRSFTKYDIPLEWETVNQYQNIMNNFNKTIYAMSEEIDYHNIMIAPGKTIWGKTR